MSATSDARRAIEAAYRDADDVERLRLVLHAMARGDDEAEARIIAAAPLATYRMTRVEFFDPFSDLVRVGAMLGSFRFGMRTEAAQLAVVLAALPGIGRRAAYDGALAASRGLVASLRESVALVKPDATTLEAIDTAGEDATRSLCDALTEKLDTLTSTDAGIVLGVERFAERMGVPEDVALALLAPAVSAPTTTARTACPDWAAQAEFALSRAACLPLSDAEQAFQRDGLFTPAPLAADPDHADTEASP